MACPSGPGYPLQVLAVLWAFRFYPSRFSFIIYLLDSKNYITETKLNMYLFSKHCASLSALEIEVEILFVRYRTKRLQRKARPVRVTPKKTIKNKKQKYIDVINI